MYRLENDRVLYLGEATSIDGQSFEELPYEFAWDSNWVYYCGVPQESLKRSSFRLLDEFYVRDEAGVYLVLESELKPLPVEGDRFRTLGFGYACDGSSGFWLGQPFASDLGSLTPVGFGVALDELGVIWEDRRITSRALNPRTARVHLGDAHLFVWDESSVWFSQNKGEAAELSPINPATFKVLEGRLSTDDVHRFDGAQKLSY